MYQLKHLNEMLDTHFLPYNSKSFVLHSIFTRIHQPASIQLLRSKTQWSFYSLFPHPIVSRFITQRANAEPGCSEVKTACLSEFWKLDLKRKKNEESKELNAARNEIHALCLEDHLWALLLHGHTYRLRYLSPAVHSFCDGLIVFHCTFSSHVI